MKKILLILSLSLTFSAVWAQQTVVDRLVRAALADTAKPNYPFIPNKDSLFRLLPYTRQAAAKTDIVYQIIDYGRATYMAGINYHYKVLRWAQKHNDTIAEVVAAAEIGPIMAGNGDPVNGVKTCFSALRLAEKTGNKRLIGISYQNLGICYQGNNTSLFKFYIEKALKYSRAGGEKLLVGYELSNLRDIFRDLHQNDSATYYSLKSLEWVVNHRINLVIARALVAYGRLQDENVHLKYFRLAEKIALHQHDGFPYDVTAAFFIGQYYQKHNNLDSALFYARKAYNATRTSALSTKLNASLLLSNCFKKNNADSILKYRVEYDNLKDSLQNISQFERAQAVAFEDEQNHHEMEVQNDAYQANLRIYVLGIVVAFLLLLAFIFWRNNRKSKLANQMLQRQKEQVQQTLHELKTTQAQLVQREKMASLGELTAGIAHEIQNPLNFVNNFSEVNKEMLEELKVETKKPKAERDEQLETELINDLIGNEEKINYHGKRADAIVKGMLQHSNASAGSKEPTNINALADEYMRLAYHGLRSKDKNFNAELVTNFDAELPLVNVIPQDIGRVLLNLFNNAFYAVNQKQKTAAADYKPEVTVTTTSEKGQVIIKVSDNGNGIPEAIKDKIMQPFFTTKPTGEGTGLGLSLSYDIVVKGHGGSISVDTKEGEFTQFSLILPLNK